MKLLLICLLLFVSQIAANEKWESYKTTHGKKYNAQQDAIRRVTFEQTETRINAHNARFQQGLESFTMEHNVFSDMTSEQKQRRLGKRRVKGYKKSTTAPQGAHSHTALPATYDLRTNKCMPAIKNQGSCGSCWAFATTTPIEYQKCVKTGKLVTLSEQQLVDCTYATSYDGCNGGDHHDPWYYLFKAGGIQPSSTYAYTSGTSGKDAACKFSKAKVYAKLANAGTDIPQNETAIQAALVAKGPITFAYYVSNSFYSYKSGVFSDSTCKKDFYSLNHEMVIVGYGVSGTTPYWIIRNQWGTSWGQKGYAFIKRGTNECGIAVEAGYPTVV